MIVGLFICDHVPGEYQVEFGDYPDMFARLFPGFKWKLYDVTNGHFPENLDGCEIYMATGSRHSVYENIDWINQMKKIIQELYSRDKYFIGFCFGHQLLGEAMGGKVEKSLFGWCVGLHEFTTKNRRDWMVPFQSRLSLLMMCQDQVVEVPENTTVLASAEKCPNGIIQVGEKMLGIQAHPEFTKSYDRFLMEKRVGRIGKGKVEAGIWSLEKTVDAKLIRDWVLAFLQK